MPAGANGGGDAVRVRGLGFSGWVDDGWHATYAKAPKTSVAWEPKEGPETVRGGGRELQPWQSGGEALLAHPAHRDPGGDDDVHAVRLAMELPARR
ncbi:MAG: hypothetical protein JNK82_22720 [Myxococcaceae bacterium]|nr:hypothetical protein [Myxococcaceae bacterium]